MRQGLDLAKLPEFVPDRALWPRIVAAREAQLRRRWLGGGGLAAIAAGVLAAVLLVPRLPVAPTDVDAVAAGERESRMLEVEWLRVAPDARPLPSARMRAIDAALQAAYDRGAPEDEISPLWQRRNEALRGLIVRAQAGVAADAVATVTRI
jgi:hypothetical protein